MVMALKANYIAGVDPYKEEGEGSLSNNKSFLEEKYRKMCIKGDIGKDQFINFNK